MLSTLLAAVLSLTPATVDATPVVDNNTVTSQEVGSSRGKVRIDYKEIGSSRGKVRIEYKKTGSSRGKVRI